MKKSELFSIPEKALMALCDEYDERYGVFIDPELVGNEIYEFYLECIEEEKKMEEKE